MCDLCVIDSVKKRMLGQTDKNSLARRHFLRTGAAGAVTGAAAVAGLSLSSPVYAATGVTDMTHELYEDFPTYFGKPGLEINQIYNYAEHKFNFNSYVLNEHTGTHLDAPLHFSENGQSVAEIPVDHLVVPLCVINIAERAANNPDAELTPDDIKAWIAKHGDIPERACVAMHSGWGQYTSTDKFRNADGDGAMHFPGFHIDAVQMLMEETGTVGIAVDSLSLDNGVSSTFPVHYAWLPSNRWGIECLANLDKVPESGATLVVGSPKVRGGTGGPSRIMALV